MGTILDVPEHLTSSNSPGLGKELEHGGCPPVRGDPGRGQPELPTRAPGGLGGREGASASRSPSDDEMWPFTFTLQCQPLNHCLGARAQGCSPSCLPTKPPPGTRGAPTAAGDRRRDASPPLLLRPSASLDPPLPSRSFFFFLLFCPKDPSEGPGGHSAQSKPSKSLELTFLPQYEVTRMTSWSREGIY